MGASRRKSDYTPEEWAAFAAKRKVAARARYLANKEEILAKRRAHRVAHKREEAERGKAYRAANKASVAQHHHAYYLQNKEKHRALTRTYYLENKDAILACGRAYYEANRKTKALKAKAWCATPAGIASRTNSKHKRRARERNGCTTTEFKAWRDAAEKVCFYCGIECAGKFHVDHYIPLAAGGEHDIHNLRIACASCNQRKCVKHPDVFLAQLQVAR